MATKDRFHVEVKQDCRPIVELDIMSNTARVLFGDKSYNLAAVVMNADQLEALLGKIKRAAVMLRAAESVQ